MQPIYCVWEAGGRKSATPGLRPRITEVKGKVLSALGPVAEIEVTCNDARASDQEWAEARVQVPDGCEVQYDPVGRVLMIARRKYERVQSNKVPQTKTA